MPRISALLLHGSYREAVDGSRERAEVVELAGYVMCPRPKTDGGKAFGWLAGQVIAIICDAPSATHLFVQAVTGDLVA